QVLGDVDRLSELIMALLENAVKYNHHGGTVWLDATTRDAHHEIVIEDTGWGIAPDDLPHVFERFYRSAKARAEDGTGLGLAIAEWIAHEHDATIAIDSVPDDGTTLTISFPAARPTAITVASGVAASSF